MLGSWDCYSFSSMKIEPDRLLGDQFKTDDITNDHCTVISKTNVQWVMRETDFAFKDRNKVAACMAQNWSDKASIVFMLTIIALLANLQTIELMWEIELSPIIVRLHISIMQSYYLLSWVLKICIHNFSVPGWTQAIKLFIPPLLGGC